MNGIYGQNNNPTMPPGMIPYGPPISGMSGGESLFQIIWRGKWLVLISAILGLGAGYAYFRMLRPEYTSVSRLLVEKPNQGAPGLPLPPGSKPNLETQASMITSRGILMAAMNDPNVLALGLGNDRLSGLIQGLSAKVGKDDIIYVMASSEDPNGPPAIINAVVQAYIRLHEDNKKLSAADYLKDLNLRLERNLVDLKKKRQDLILFEQRNPAVVENARGGAASKTLDSLKQELLTSGQYAKQQELHYQRLVRIAQESGIGLNGAAADDPNGAVGRPAEQDPNRTRQDRLLEFRYYVLHSQQGSGEVMADDRERADLVDELEGTRRQLESLLSGRIVARSEIVLLQSRENQLLERIAGFDRTFVRKHIALAKTDWEDAVNREQTLKERYEAELANAQSLLGLVSEYAILTSECDILERQCSSLSEQISKVPQDATREGLSIYVLERAVRAEAPLSQEARILGVGLVLGLMVGCGLAFLRDMRDERVRSADEIVAILGLPILGAVPTIPRKGLFFPRPRSWLSPDSRESESFRSIRTALFYGSSSGDAKTLLVTSPGPLDGKTTMVSNLGIAMAHAGQKTLIVDADLRKPIQHRIFSKDGHGKGLIDVLAGTVTVDEAIRATEIAGLDVLEGGRTIGNPSELLSSDALDAVIEQLKSRYDRILVDSPPIGIVADAQILAAKCASTLLVLRAERSSRIGTQCARDALSAVSAKVVGVVVNDVRKRDTRYSHYGSGAYGYYHGRYESGRPHVATRRLPGGADPRPGDGPTTSETGPQDVWSRTW